MLLSAKTSLLLLSERYTITHDINFTASHLRNLKIHRNAQKEVYVQCQLPAEFVFSNVAELKIFSLKFYSCTLQYLQDSKGYSARKAVLTICKCIFTANPLNYAINIVDENFQQTLGISINNCTFSSNNGAVSLSSDIISFSTNFLVTDSVFLNNWRQDCGAALCANGAIINVHQNCFINNTASGVGGAIQFYGSSATISNCLFNSNSAATGGAIDSMMADLLILDSCYFHDNFADTSGGAISSETVEIMNCHFNNNSAGKSGGALYITDNFDDNRETSISNSSFYLNHAINGGAVYCKKTQRNFNSLLLSQTCFDSNFAVNGGSLYLSCLVLLGCNAEISNNRATERGGAIYAVDSEILTNGGSIVALANNTATNGGALFLTGSSLIHFNRQSLVTFEHNMAVDKGGWSLLHS